MSEPLLPFVRVRDGITVAVRVAPRAARQRIGEIAKDAGGGRVIKIAVTAPPEGGKANDAVIRLLAKAWRVPKTSFSLISGAANRRKMIHVAGDAEDLYQRLNTWMESHDG